MDETQNPGGPDVPSWSAPASTAAALMGPCAAGYSAQMLLYGVFVALTLMAVQSGELRAQNRPARGAIFVSLFLNTVYTAITVYENYDASVSQNRTYDYLSNGNETWSSLSMLNGAVTALTEAFLAAKAGMLIQNRKIRYAFWAWMTCLIGLVLAGSAITTADGYFYLWGAEPSSLAVGYADASSLWLLSSAIADLSISVCCGWALYSRIAGFNETTDSLLRRLIWISVRTASYTTILSLAGAATNLAWGDDSLLSYVAIALWLPMLVEPSTRVWAARRTRLRRGVYVRKSVHAYDSKGVSVRRLGPPSSTEEHELSVAPRTTPSVRIFVEQQSLSVTEYDEPDLEAGKSSAGPEWRSEWRGEKSWEAPPV